MTYWKGVGNELGEGLGLLAQNLIGTQNTLRQQDEARQQLALDNQFRQQQADEQRRQFDEQARRTRDSQTFQFLSGQQQQLTQILAKGGYAKGSPEYTAAENALKETNKLMTRVLRGDELSPEDLSGYDTLMGNVGAVIGQGAVNIGQRAEAQDTAALAATRAGTTATLDANNRANELQPFSVAGAGYQNRVQAVAANVGEGTQQAQIDTGNAQGRLAVTQADTAAQTAPFTVRTAAAAARNAESGARVAEGTEGATIARAGLENELLGTQLDTARWSLSDLQTKAPLVYQGLKLSNDTAQQALDFNAEMQPERMTALRQQNEQTRQAIDQSGELFPWQKRGLVAQVNIQETQAEIVQATKSGTISRENAESWATLAREVRDPAAFEQLVKDGVMTEEQAAPFKKLAQYYRDSAAATLDQARAQARTSQSQTRVQERTEGAQIRTATAQAEGAEVSVDAARFDLQRAKQLFPIELRGAQTALDTANFQLQLAREKKPFDLALLKAQVNTLEQQLSQNAQLFGPNLEQARLQVQRLRTEVSVLEQTAPATVRTANAQATSAEAAAAVDAALIPSKIQAGQLSVQQGQAALNAQLLENRFNSATFADRVRAVNLGTSQGLQQLLNMKQEYAQNKQKFPKELEYLDAQIALMQAQAKETASKALATDGNGVTDKKTMIASLTQMRMINSQNVRAAQADLRATVQRYLPNARFSVDKYDSKSFSTLIANASNLTPEQRQELQNAQAALDAAQAQSADLSVAFGQVSTKGRIDPKVAERLGIYAPGEGDTADPYGTRTYGGVQMVTKFPATSPVPKTFTPEAGFHISRVASNLGIDANALAAIISFETGGTFNPNARNPKSTGTGLIQFMAGTGGKSGTYYGMTRDQFGKLPFGQQMQYVERYLKERGIGPGSTIADVYAAVTGSGYKKGSAEYEKNKVWDANGDGTIEKGEQVLSPQFQAHVRDYFGGTPKTGPAAPTTAVKPPVAPATPTPSPTPSPTAPATTPAKLTPQTARPLLMKAFAENDKATASRIFDALVAGGMTPQAAQAWITSMKPRGGR